MPGRESGPRAGDWMRLSAQREDPGTLVNRVTGNVLAELGRMRTTLGPSARSSDFALLEDTAVTALSRIGRQIVKGRIRPWIAADAGASTSLLPRAPRLGIFPTAANPFHWAHLLAGLSVMERFALDKVIYVIAGNDSRKPHLAPEPQRHAMAQEVLELFQPLFAYSPVALGTDSCGEENLFTLLGQAPFQRVHAFYIAGSDHYHRYRPGTRNPDTIERIEQGISIHLHGFDPRRHRVSVVFLQRGAVDRDVVTWLDVRRVGGLPVQASSTEIRDALAEGRGSGRVVLSTLPFAALLSIRRHNLYGVTGTGASPALGAVLLPC